MAKISGGYVAACGQGMENEKTGIKGDPRIDWRGTPVAVDMNGNMIWYRMDNWGVGNIDEEDGTQIPTASSAYEWVSVDPSSPSTMYITTDEAWGMGFATFDLTQQE